MSDHRTRPWAETNQLCATDSELVQKASDGSDGAFHELVDRYGQELFRLAFALVGNAADAEDVVQETFIGALRGLRTFRGASSVKTWLLSILSRQAARCHRTRGRRKTVPIEAGLHRPELVLTGGGEGADARMDVRAAMDALSVEHRQVVTLREFEGLSYDEIAAVLGVPRGTVESRLHRARRHLQERLKGYLG